MGNEDVYTLTLNASFPDATTEVSGAFQKGALRVVRWFLFEIAVVASNGFAAVILFGPANPHEEHRALFSKRPPEGLITLQRAEDNPRYTKPSAKQSTARLASDFAVVSCVILDDRTSTAAVQGTDNL